jgi:peptide-methionine (S)-S-oxide reductase
MRTLALALTVLTLVLGAAPAMSASEKTPSGGDAARSAPGEGLATATLGGGCFWCLEAVYEELAGVESAVSGYAGGHVKNPGYREVCGGGTGHAEVVQIRFDPAVISYGELLTVFFEIHDPTTLNRQGADVGTQYRSLILYHGDEQERTARRLIRDIEAEGVFRSPIVTELAPYREFYAADASHQEYYARNPEQGYCRVVIAPKLEKFRKRFKESLKR